jgi:AcrR family transcriptional regulator
LHSERYLNSLRNVHDGRRRPTRAEAKQRTRELLLDAAATTFARKGYSGASVEEIAEAAGFSIGALYSNFTGKEQLFLELLSSRASGRVSAAAEILADTDGPDPLGALGGLLVDVADKDMDFAPLQAEFWLYAVRNPETMDTLADRMREPREALAGLVGDAMRRHGTSPEVSVDAVSTVVFALFQGLVRQRRIDPASVPPELFGQALRWLVTGLDRTEEERR